MREKSDHKLNESSVSEEAMAICTADKALIEAESSRNLEAAMAHMAPDVILHPPDLHAVERHEAVRKFYLDWFALPYTAIRVLAQTVSVAASGDLAYLVGESSLIMNGPDGEYQVPGKYLGVWRKIDNEWLLAAISWTANIRSS
jgi:ketosteroid isomerase-like protein